MTMINSPTALALFSGGLDSLLAARMIMSQGLSVQCVHFYSPFFGNPDAIDHWEKIYGLSIMPVDIGDIFVQLLRKGPGHGFGKVFNPCVDCKITMLHLVSKIKDELGAIFAISGEVLGQRPMSQRRDTLNLIRKQAGAKDWLLRPLCAKLLEPTPMEISKLVDRQGLGDISGRSRKNQLALAKKFEITEIPTPAGGCRLTEKENAKRYWPILQHIPDAQANDFYLANVGRQFWAEQNGTFFWLVIGRNQADNTRITELARPEDIILQINDLPGPIALMRHSSVMGTNIFTDILFNIIPDAASLTTSFSPRAVEVDKAGGKIRVSIKTKEHEKTITAKPERRTCIGFYEPELKPLREHVRKSNQSLNLAHKKKLTTEIYEH